MALGIGLVSGAAAFWDGIELFDGELDRGSGSIALLPLNPVTGAAFATSTNLRRSCAFSEHLGIFLCCLGAAGTNSGESYSQSFHKKLHKNFKKFLDALERGRGAS